jgi:hypothetical protein
MCVCVSVYHAMWVCAWEASYMHICRNIHGMRGGGRSLHQETVAKEALQFMFVCVCVSCHAVVQCLSHRLGCTALCKYMRALMHTHDNTFHTKSTFSQRKYILPVKRACHIFALMCMCALTHALTVDVPLRPCGIACGLRCSVNLYVHVILV